MKALVIADDDVVLGRIKNLLNKMNIDMIVYRWLLKALDNVEEIEPQLVIISTRDYPRHWKTFVQYTSGLNISQPKVILFADREFSLDEKKKAQALGINGIFPEECTDDDFSGIITSVMTAAIKKSNACLFMFTNPVTNNFVCGKVKSFEERSLVFIPDFLEAAESLNKTMTIEMATIKTNKGVIGVKAVIISLPAENPDSSMTLLIEG